MGKICQENNQARVSYWDPARVVCPALPGRDPTAQPCLNEGSLENASSGVANFPPLDRDPLLLTAAWKAKALIRKGSHPTEKMKAMISFAKSQPGALLEMGKVGYPSVAQGKQSALAQGTPVQDFGLSHLEAFALRRTE